MAFVAKLIYEDDKKQKDIRRFQFQNATYEHLLSLLQTAFGPGTFVVKYQDNDGDILTVSSSAELEEAFRVAAEDHKTLKLFVAKVKAPISPAAEFVSVQREGDQVSFVEPDEHKYDEDLEVAPKQDSQSEMLDVNSEDLDRVLTESLIEAENARLESEQRPVAAEAKQGEPKQGEVKQEQENVKQEPKPEDARKNLIRQAIAFLSDKAALDALPLALDAALQCLDRQDDAATVIATVTTCFPASVQNLEFVKNLGSEKHLACLNCMLPGLVAHVSMIKVIAPQILANIVSQAPEIVRALESVLEQWGNPEMELDIDLGKLTGECAPLLGMLPCLFGRLNLPFNVSPAIFQCRANREENCAEPCKQNEQPVHVHVRCDGCNGGIVGARFKCTVCPDFDLCESCEGKNIHPPHHNLIKYRLPADQSEPPVPVHVGVTCDGCGMVPIRGIRYKCSVCYDFDLCSNCEKTGQHPDNHPLIKMKISQRQGHRFERRHHGHPMMGPGCGRGGWFRQQMAAAACARNAPKAEEVKPKVESPKPKADEVQAKVEPPKPKAEEAQPKVEAPMPKAEEHKEEVPKVEVPAVVVSVPIAAPAAPAPAPVVVAVPIVAEQAVAQPIPVQVQPARSQPAAPSMGLGAFLPFLRRPNYAEQIQQLRDMGFNNDDAALLRLLQENNGDVGRVALALL